MTTFSKIFAGLCATTYVLLAFSNLAFAAGTLANTPISNTAKLAYDINGVLQTTITSPAATFMVDRKINLSVVEANGAPSIVGQGQGVAVTTFKVSNTGNDTQDFDLAVVNLPNGTTIFNNLPQLSDSFDASGCMAYGESGANAGYQAAEDLTMFIDELAPDSTKTVYVVCSISAEQAINKVAVVSLTATALMGGTTGTKGSSLSNDALTPNTAGVNNLFADPDTLVDNTNGTIPRQTPGDAKAFARGAYRVVSVATNVTKSATCSPTPANCSQAKTGTVITYQLLITIKGSASVVALVVTDPLPANLSYANGLIVPPSAVSSDFGVTTPNTLTVNFGNVIAPANLTIQFNATIN